MLEMLRRFIKVITEYPFHCFRFIFGNILIGATQVISIGSLFPILYTIIDQKDQANIFIKYFNQALSLVGLEPTLASYLLLFVAIALISAVTIVLVEKNQAHFLRLLEEKMRLSLVDW